jgi:hypothetical protein
VLLFVLPSDQPKVKVEAPFTPVNAIDERPVVPEQSASSVASGRSRISFAVLAAEPVTPFLNEPVVVVPVPPRVAVIGGPRLKVVEPGLKWVAAAVVVPVEVYLVVMVPAENPVSSEAQVVPTGAVTTLDPLAPVMVTPLWVRPLLATRLLAVMWVVNLTGTVEGVLRKIGGEMVIVPFICPVSVPAKVTGVVAAPLGPLPTMMAALGNASAAAANAIFLNFMWLSPSP